MPAFKTSTIRQTLERKLQARTDGTRKHIYFYVYDGPTLVSTTHISHGVSEISDTLMSLMARQLAIPKPFWVELYRCNHDRDAYLKRVSRI